MTTTASIEHALEKHRSGDLAGAREAYGLILEGHPEDVTAVHLMGVICSQRHEWQEAEFWFRRSIALAPAYAPAYGNLGLVLSETGRSEEALECLERSLTLDPGQAGVWNNLGMVQVRCSRYRDAVHACRTALDLAPASADALCNLSNALRGIGDLNGALDAATRATEARPGLAEAFNSKGNILAGLDRTGEAMDAYTRAIELRPDYLSPLNNLAKLSRERGDLVNARALYGRALGIDPASADAHWGSSFVHLLAGQLDRGWEEYAWRWRLATVPDARVFDSPRWDGTARRGMTLLLVCEQGLGDAIQFIRYAPLLASEGVRVIVEAPEALVRLLGTVAGVERVVVRGTPLPAHDAHCPLLDLPGHCRTTLATIPANVPYLRVTPAADHWKERVECDPSRIRVGLVWAGSTGHIDDRRRSCGVDLMSRIAEVPGVTVYNLQQNVNAGSVPGSLRSVWVDHSAAFHDVMDTAGLVAHLDLVITVDTMMAHLAGALGIPVWLMVPYAPDWRWMLGRRDSPWYPTMHLFRQPEPGAWTEVMDRVVEELSGFVSERVSPAPSVAALPGIEQALQLHEAGDLAAAGAAYRAILHTAPDDHDALYLLSVLGHQTGRAGDGLRCVRRLLELQPSHAEGWNSLGNLLHDTGDLQGAVDAFEKALRIRPDYGDVVYNMGRVLCDLWRLDEALACCERARTLGVPEKLARNNAGLVLYRQGRFGAAIDEFRRALALDHGFVDAHWNLAHALLHTGEFGEGWKEFEWRWARPDFQSLRVPYTMPRWDGTPMPDRTILLWAEQGFGDVIHCLRYLQAVADRGLRIIVEAPLPLQRLISASPYVADVVPRGSLPPHDVQLPLMSLPGVLGHPRGAFPSGPFITVDDAARERWEERLVHTGSALRVGMVWSGSRTNPAGRYRSVPIAALAPLADVPGVVYVDLQKDDPDHDFAGSPLAMIGADWTREFIDFTDTAALISVLDVVVTIDTAVAHLAGALGKEVWLLLSKHHDWRWGGEGETTPWYRSVRLLRQSRQGDWQDVVARCHAMLERRISFEASANAGVARMHEGNPGQGVRDLQRAVALAPDHAGVHFDLALALLATGEWTRGFVEYEWRLRMEGAHASCRPYPQPRWHGESIRGRTILVYAEQGFGDAIQFVRYAGLLHDLGARVIVECRRELTALFHCVAGVDAVIARGDAPPAFDLHVPMLSIPGILGTTPQNVPANIPYIVLPEGPASERPVLFAEAQPGPMIGLVWSGNSVSSIDGERSLSRQEMLRFLPSDGVTYVRLQPGHPGAGVEEQDGEHHVIDASPVIGDFMDTARIISHCDAVISVDTAVAHLAGALGKTVVNLIPVHADWRWLTKGETTAWYPTMRLRRQSQRGVWEDVLQGVGHDIHRIREHYDHQ